MKIILPVTKHDQETFIKRNTLLIKQGGLKSHQGVIYAAPSAKHIADAEYDRLRDVFGSLEIIVPNVEPDFGDQFINQNVFFYGCVMNLERQRNRSYWLWLEADATPTTPEWANALDSEYRANGTPYCGNIVELPFNSGGKLITNTGEFMMMGVGIYPPNMVDLANPDIRALVIDLGKQGQQNPKCPWDVYLRGEMRRAGWSNTKLIADQWNTQNYRRVANGYECEPCETTRLVRNRGGFIPDSVVLIHGCKDDTLLDLLMEDKKPVSKASKEPEAKVEEVKAEEVKSDPERPQFTEEQLRVKSDVEARLAKGSLRIAQLVDEFQTSIEELKPLLEQLGFKVSKPGWITKA